MWVLAFEFLVIQPTRLYPHEKCQHEPFIAYQILEKLWMVNDFNVQQRVPKLLHLFCNGVKVDDHNPGDHVCIDFFAFAMDI